MFEVVWKYFNSLGFLGKKPPRKKKDRYQVLWEKKSLYADLTSSHYRGLQELDDRRGQLRQCEREFVKPAEFEDAVELLSDDPLQFSYYIRLCRLDNDICAHCISALREEIKLLEEREKFFQEQEHSLFKLTWEEERELESGVGERHLEDK